MTAPAGNGTAQPTSSQVASYPRVKRVFRSGVGFDENQLVAAKGERFGS